MKKELFRKCIHMSFILTIFSIDYFSIRTTQIGLILFGLLYYLFEQARLHNKNIPILSKIAQNALRPQEEKTLAFAPITLALGIVLVTELYDNNYAIKTAIVAATVGDSMAAIFGKLLPKYFIWWNKKKTWGGMLAHFASVFGICLIWTTPLQAVILGFVSAGVESLDLEYVDNLMVPLSVGATWYFL